MTEKCVTCGREAEEVCQSCGSALCGAHISPDLKCKDCTDEEDRRKDGKE